MVVEYEQREIIRYVRRLTTNVFMNAKSLCEVCEYLERNSDFLGIPSDTGSFIEDMGNYQDALNQKSVRRVEVRSIATSIDEYLCSRISQIEEVKQSDMENNLNILGDELSLDDIERDFFGFLIRYFRYESFRRLMNDLSANYLTPLDLCAISLNLECSELLERLSSSGSLRTAGIVTIVTNPGTDLDDHFEVPDVVQSALQKACGGSEDIRNCILGNPEVATLHWDDFEHLGETIERMADFLRVAIEQKISGVNVLLWGPPGTGKTELCKTLAEHLGVRLYSIGEQDDEGGEPSRRERLCSMQLAQNLLRYQNRSLLLFDEMDDLFEGQSLARMFGGRVTMGSKVYTNRLFEKNPIPTVWIINDANLLDATILRRMSLAVEIKVPPTSVRARVWQRMLDKNSIVLSPPEVKTLAELDVPPAVVDTAVGVAKQIGGKIEDFRFATNGLIKVLSGKDPQQSPELAKDFDLGLMQTDTQLDVLIKQVQKGERRDFSLCLYGPPGTGKSAFVRHLAQSIGLPVLFKRASDFLDPYVGNTEQKIAAAFREARDKDAFLVFDEADSLLGDRRYAQRSWEVSQVNEMLTWMEDHPLPFACTTNLMERLDQASLRRFIFKCHCDYLSNDKIVMACESFFANKIDAKLAANLTGLTPGDFALVKKKATILGCVDDMAQITSLLQQELQAKDCRVSNPIGFRQ